MEYRCATCPPPARHLPTTSPPPAHHLPAICRYMPTISKLIADADAGVAGDLRMLTIREHRFPFLRKVVHWNPNPNP